MRKAVFSPEPRPDLPHITTTVRGIPVRIPERLTPMLTEDWARMMMDLCKLDELEVRVPVAGWLAGLVAVGTYKRGRS